MRLHRVTEIILILTPLVLGAILAIALQTKIIINPVLHFQALIDLGTFLLVIGGLLSAGFLGFWLLRRQVMVKERIKDEKIMEAARLERRRFLQQLDHELKNPLTALKTELAYLSQDMINDGASKVLGDIKDQVERIENLIADLRKLAQIEEQPLEFEPVDINELLTEIIEAVKDQPGFADHKLHLTLLQSPWKLPSIPGDRGLLWLACYNLVDNALKFTPPSAEIELRAFEVRPWLIIEVTDNGPGISSDELPHIFEELFRGKNARNISGSGLGLPMVRAIISRHKGDISVQSRPGQGTIFTLRLPLLS